MSPPAPRPAHRREQHLSTQGSAHKSRTERLHLKPHQGASCDFASHAAGGHVRITDCTLCALRAVLRPRTDTGTRRRPCTYSLMCRQSQFPWKNQGLGPLERRALSAAHCSWCAPPTEGASSPEVPLRFPANASSPDLIGLNMLSSLYSTNTQKTGNRSKHLWAQV